MLLEIDTQLSIKWELQDEGKMRKHQIICFFTGSFQQFDKDGSGEAELNLTEVSCCCCCIKNKPKYIVPLISVRLTLFFSLLVALHDNVWLKSH